MCEKCKSYDAIRGDKNPLETLTLGQRLVIECSLRLVRTAMAAGEPHEALLNALEVAMPPAAAEFVLVAALMDPLGPTLPLEEGTAIQAIIAVNREQPTVN